MALGTPGLWVRPGSGRWAGDAARTFNTRTSRGHWWHQQDFVPEVAEFLGAEQGQEGLSGHRGCDSPPAPQPWVSPSS